MSLVFGELPAAPAAADCSAMPRGVVDDLSIMRLWRRKFDTARIAAALEVDESDVANRLAQLRDMGAR